MPVKHRNNNGSDKKADATNDNNASSQKKKGPFSGRYNPTTLPKTKGGANDSFLSHQKWSRIVMAGSIFVIIYFTSNAAPKATFMAKQSERIEKKVFQQFLCAPSFKKEIMDLGNKGCVPTKCGRAVLDNVVSDQESDSLLALAKKGFAKGGGSGGASILDLHSGALSKGDAFVSIYKSHPDLFTPEDFKVYGNVKENVKRSIADHFGLDSSSLYLTHPTFFSRIDATPARTMHDEYWHVHVDKVTYPEFHYTSLLYLTDHGLDFKGGEFIFVDEKLNRTVQPRYGRVSFFTSGGGNKHHVEPVTEGTRYALTMGFSCNPKNAIPEPGSDNHAAFMDSKIMEESAKSSTKQSSTTKAPKEEL